MSLVNYNIDSIIDSDISNIDVNIGSKINICAYQIIYSEHTPFLQYLLFKEPTCMQFDLPFYYMTNTDKNNVCSQSVCFSLI